MVSLSFDPDDLPLLRADDHLPKIAPLRLRADAMRERFRSQAEWAPELVFDHLPQISAGAQASVLIPVRQRDGDLYVVLTRRTEHLTHHPGQVSFPGGRAEPEDPDAVSTALREAHEEIGLQREFVEVLGTLPVYMTGTGFLVTPVVGLLKPGFSLDIDPHEVAEVFEVPLSFLMDPANHRWYSFNVDGSNPRTFLSMLWQGAAVPDGQARRYVVWGATAAMLRNLYRFLQA